MYIAYSNYTDAQPQGSFLNLNNEALKKFASARYLVIIDSCVNWKNHMDATKKN